MFITAGAKRPAEAVDSLRFLPPRGGGRLVYASYLHGPVSSPGRGNHASDGVEVDRLPTPMQLLRCPLPIHPARSSWLSTPSREALEVADATRTSSGVMKLGKWYLAPDPPRGRAAALGRVASRRGVVDLGGVASRICTGLRAHTCFRFIIGGAGDRSDCRLLMLFLGGGMPDPPRAPIVLGRCPAVAPTSTVTACAVGFDGPLQAGSTASAGSGGPNFGRRRSACRSGSGSGSEKHSSPSACPRSDVGAALLPAHALRWNASTVGKALVVADLGLTLGGPTSPGGGGSTAISTPFASARFPLPSLPALGFTFFPSRLSSGESAVAVAG